MNYREEEGNLFDKDIIDKYYLTQCCSGDFALNRGIALQFENVFHIRNKLKEMSHNIKVGDVVLVDSVFNLVTKRNFNDKPTYKSLRSSLENMKIICIDDGIKYVAMYKIGCSLDRLDWRKVRLIIQDIFKDVDIEILVKTGGSSEWLRSTQLGYHITETTDLTSLL